MTFQPRNPVPPANRYQGVATGPSYVHAFEDQSGVPIDGTNAGVRTWSPFTFELRLPAVFMAEGPATLSLSRAAASTGAGNTVTNPLLASSSSADLRRAANAIVSAASAPRPSGYGLPATNTLATVFQAADIRNQVETIRNIPPLMLLVNPTEMSVSSDKIQGFQDRSRFGYIYQAWGDQQPTISFSGSTGGFVAGSPKGTQGATDRNTGLPTGYQWASRRDSAAWQNFTSLVHFYRSNGYIFDTIGQTEAHLFIGSVVITYDDWQYEGHIDSLSFSFDENSPLRVQFDMQFTANRVVDLSPPGSTVAPYTSSGPTSMDPVAEAGRTALRQAAGTVALTALGAAAASTGRRLERATPPLPDEEG